jgi:hypothetical protein
MPIRSYFDAETLRLDFSGHVSREELFRALRELETLEAAPAVTPHRIVDLSAITESANSFPEVFALAAQRKRRQFPNAFKSAIVATRPADIGIARMFQTLNDHPQIRIRIFPDLAAAQAWLAEV